MFKIDKNAISHFETYLRTLSSELFNAGRLFDIEIILNKNNIQVLNMDKFLKQVLNISDVKINDINMIYSHISDKEIYKIDILDLNSYKDFKIVFTVDKNVVVVGDDKKIKRTISDITIEETK